MVYYNILSIIIPYCLYTVLSIYHIVYLPYCLLYRIVYNYTVLSIYHILYIPYCLYTILSIYHIVYIPYCLYTMISLSNTFSFLYLERSHSLLHEVLFINTWQYNNILFILTDVWNWWNSLSLTNGQKAVKYNYILPYIWNLIVDLCTQSKDL